MSDGSGVAAMGKCKQSYELSREFKNMYPHYIYDGTYDTKTHG